MLKWLRGRPITPAEFWTWFQAHSHEFRTHELPANHARAMWKMLERYHADLVWGIQPAESSVDDWRLEISADGKARLIPVVEELVMAAPRLPGWEVAAFRQPQAEPRVTLKGSILGPDDIKWVEEGWEEERIGLTIFVPMNSPIRADDLTQAGLFMLDAVLGEYTVITKIGDLDFKHISVVPDRARPLRDLPAHLTGYLTQG